VFEHYVTPRGKEDAERKTMNSLGNREKKTCAVWGGGGQSGEMFAPQQSFFPDHKKEKGEGREAVGGGGGWKRAEESEKEGERDGREKRGGVVHGLP